MKSPKKWIKKILIYLCIFLIAPLVIIGFLIRQPSLGSNHLSAAEIDPDVLKEHVVKLSIDLSPRSFLFRSNLFNCARYIEKEFRKTSADIVTNQVYDVHGYNYENVIARFEGKTESRIVVGAHYDSVTGTPGADDNASGVAGLLTLATLITGDLLNHTLELVAFCTEEPPYFGSKDMGSYHHASMLNTNHIDVKAMISLEMIGFFSEEKWSQDYPGSVFYLYYPTKGNFVAIVGNSSQRQLTKLVKRGMRGSRALPVYSVSIPSIVQGVDYSDHRNYWRYDYPAVMITDTAFLRNKLYHEAGDTYDRLDFNKMTDVVIQVYEAIKLIDKE